MDKSFEELLAEKLDKIEQDNREFAMAVREDLAAAVAEFYNQDHDPDTGKFDVGEDGPGRKRDNLKKAEKTLGKKAPTWAKNLLTRRIGKAQKSASATLPKNAAEYQKSLVNRVAESRVLKGE